MRIGVDLDGVLFDFAGSLRRYLISIGRDDSTLCATKTWHFYEDWGYTLEEFIAHCDAGVDAGYVFSGPARSRAAQSVQMLKDAGHSIHIITDRAFGSPGASQLATRIWLANHSIPYDTLDFSADKTIVPTDLFIEDKLENYDALDATPCQPWLVNRAWNHVPGGDDRRRLPDVYEFAQMVTTLQIDLIKPGAFA